MSEADSLANLDRYHRQTLLPGIGEAGQQRLRSAHGLVVGCGALGTVIADALARAGIGTLTIVDRDVVEATNLQRQVLFDERDVENHVPKAEAARNKLARINRQVTVHARVEDFGHRHAESFLDGVDVILDGLDNFETRYLLNDLAVKHGLPYVYGGAVAATGVSLTVLPHPRHRVERAGREPAVTWSAEEATPCLRCVFPEAPPPGTAPTCDTAGVLGPVVAMVAAHQATQALKLLTGNLDAVDRSLLSIDAWTNEVRRFDVSGARDAGDCPCCGRGVFESLAGGGSETTSLCGRNAVQITPAASAAPSPSNLDLGETARRLEPHGSFTRNEYLLRGAFRAEMGSGGDPIELTLFPDGRAIIKGTAEPEVARSIYARYVGA
ncbi:MAG: thiazole biosynthesis adenylyltransferase ThiF [Planctomycetes bacterium]|nr:thiazole biosynthesis adenylyltransferase ThiF [Planctomycetota bacterium]